MMDFKVSMNVLRNSTRNFSRIFSKFILVYLQISFCYISRNTSKNIFRYISWDCSMNNCSRLTWTTRDFTKCIFRPIFNNTVKYLQKCRQDFKNFFHDFSCVYFQRSWSKISLWISSYGDFFEIPRKLSSKFWRYFYRDTNFLQNFFSFYSECFHGFLTNKYHNLILFI